MTAPYFMRRQQIAVKLETTEGVDAVPADADVIAPVFAPEWVPAFGMDAREAVDAAFSPYAQVSGELSAIISFATEIKGSGTAGTAPMIGPALKACKLKETIVTNTSVTYKSTSVSIPSATVELREGSTDTTFKSKKILGARGTVRFEFVKGQIGRAFFEFTGKYVKPTETVQFTTPATTPAPKPSLSMAFSFQGVGTLKAQNITVDMANAVVLRNDVNDSTGNTAAVITGGLPIGSIDPEQTDIATIDFFANIVANTEGVLTFALTGAAGNIATFTMSKAQIINAAEADRDGIRTEGLDLQFNKVAAAGDDEVQIVFT